ncbi:MULTISPECIES: hypothetical protein [Pseudoalteromonas]|uniref:Uncharacterized protein n=1 Tax=Pseudoalteromonas amylolytica TaxID=1859457 RepID=A0A1S1MYB3_9GAMM|nr:MULTISPECIES: hypothetical protein [Pseudoalteromonas]OHU89158.1 hypothetical protein BFC16_05815 [Pseudoalteromonas sp. JW3]OHU92058.1 hypothetical protein BET10_06920 [Pseudoalteromonas amylolytica]
MDRRSFISCLGVSCLLLTPVYSSAGSYLSTSFNKSREEFESLLHYLHLNDSRGEKDRIFDELSEQELELTSQMNNLFRREKVHAKAVIKKTPKFKSLVNKIAVSFYLNTTLNDRCKVYSSDPSIARRANAETHNFKAYCGGQTGFWQKPPTAV